MNKKNTWDDYLSGFTNASPEGAPPFPGRAPLKNTSDRKTVERLDGPTVDELRSSTWMHRGQLTQFYTIGELAKAVGRKPVTIRSWEAKGWLPQPKLRTPSPSGTQLPGKASKGRRLYTRDQVVYLMDAVDRFNLSQPQTADWVGFRTHMANYPQD